MQSYFTLRRLTCRLLLPAFLAGCSSWHVQEVSPQQLITEDQPGKIRVTLTDGSQIVLEQPRVSGDTLIGCEVQSRQRCPSDPGALLRSGQQVSIALSDVRDVAIQRADFGKTAALIVIPLLVVGAVVVLFSGFCTDETSCS